MKRKQRDAIFKILLPGLSGYEKRGPLLFSCPIDHILKGFYFESSGFNSTRFYVWAFVLPLYVPTKHISFSFGRRLSGADGEAWTLTETDMERLVDDLLKAMRREGFPYFQAMKTPEEFAKKALRLLENPDDPYLREAIAYSLILGKNVDEGLKALDYLSAVLAGIDQQKTWAEDMHCRASSLRDHLSKDKIEAAKKLLIEWERQTRENLKLEPPSLANAPA